MKTLALLLLALPLAAQQGPLGLYCPSTSSKPLVCSIESTAVGATTLQWTITTSVTTTSAVPASLDPAKSTGANGPKMNMVGINASFIRTGTAATVTFQFPSSFSCPGNSQCLTVTLSSVQATINNHAVNLAASPASARIRVKR